jgi:hypothetical protein
MTSGVSIMIVLFQHRSEHLPNSSTQASTIEISVVLDFTVNVT